MRAIDILTEKTTISNPVEFLDNVEEENNQYGLFIKELNYKNFKVVAHYVGKSLLKPLAHYYFKKESKDWELIPAHEGTGYLQYLEKKGVLQLPKHLK